MRRDGASGPSGRVTHRVLSATLHGADVTPVTGLPTMLRRVSELGNMSNHLIAYTDTAEASCQAIADDGAELAGGEGAAIGGKQAGQRAANEGFQID